MRDVGTRARATLCGAAVAAAVAATGLGAVAAVAVEPEVPRAYRNLVNPLKPSRPVLESARKLFAEHCAGCHGATGRGDGADAGLMRPPPANFTAPRVAQRSDQWLMWRVSEGVPMTEMNPYRDVLPRKDRWSLVLVIRAFSARAPARRR